MVVCLLVEWGREPLGSRSPARRAHEGSGPTRCLRGGGEGGPSGLPDRSTTCGGKPPFPQASRRDTIVPHCNTVQETCFALMRAIYLGTVIAPWSPP